MALVNAVQFSQAQPSGSAWITGISAAAAAAALCCALRETARRRGAENALSLCRAELSDTTSRLGEFRMRQLLWEQRYLGLAGAHDDVILWRDGSGRLTHMNEAFVTTFGVVRESLLGTAYHPPADSSESGIPRGNAAEPGLARIRYEQKLNTVHGWRWFAWEDHAIRAADGTVLEIQSTGRDITERKEARELQMAARSATEALRRRRQNFRQAMVRDLLPITTGLTRAATAPVLEALMPRLAALQDCLAFEGERVNVTCQPFEPRRLVAGAVSALADESPRPGCGIASVIAADVPRRVTGDPALLRQVIERLAGPPLGDGNGICIRVSAQAGRLRLVFETPWPRMPEQGGRPSDLALAAVRPVIEAMSGELAVQELDGAASVRVEIPAPAAGETADVDAVRGAAGKRPSPGTIAGTA
jgi:PAS domain S-box-containing protein